MSVVADYAREMRLKSRSELGTLALGQTFAELLRAPKVVILRGELGAGKTTLVKGWVQALGLDEAAAVTSPTFALVHQYGGRGKKVYHLDLYRLRTERELATVGLEEMASDPGALVLVEWGENFRSVVERAEAEIAIEVLEEDNRSFLVRWREPASMFGMR